MHSSALSGSVRRTLSALLATVVLTAGALLFPIPAAHAALLTGPPDVNGNYGICNIDSAHFDSGSVHVTVYRYACNVSAFTSAGQNRVLDQIRIQTTWQTNNFTDPGTVTPAQLCVSPSPLTYQTFDRTHLTLIGLQCVSGQGTGDRTVTGLIGGACLDTGSFNTGCVTSFQMRRDTLTTTGSAPTLPADWYPGGSAPDLALPVATCSQRLSAGNGAWSSAFTGGTTAAATNSVDTYSWAFGDATTSTAQSPQHVYANSGPFSSVLTVTRTANSGHLFSDGSTSKTSTCTLSVSWGIGSTTSTTTGVPGDTGTGGDGCDFWDVGCLVVAGFRSLFFPSSDTRDGMSDLWGDLTTKAPFSVMYEVVTYIPDQLVAFSDAVASGVGHNDFCTPWDMPGTNTNFYPCDNNGGNTPNLHIDTSNNELVTTVGDVLTWLIGGLILYACYRGMGEVIK